MGGDDDGTVSISQIPKRRENAFHLDVVEIRGGFIRQDNRGIESERTCYGNALLLSAGHRSRSMIHSVSQVHHLEKLLGDARALRFGIGPQCDK